MSFTIKCDKCESSVSIKDKAVHVSDKKIDLFPHSDCDGYTTSYHLHIFCNNKECKNEIEIRC